MRFADLAKGQMFRMNGTDYIKQSSRTARMKFNDRVFYFGQSDNVYPFTYTKE